MARELIGLDFGTTNTHLSLTAAGEKNPIGRDIRIFPQNAIQSVLLYTPQESRVIAFGQTAQEEWVTLSRSERRGLKLAVNFKPITGVDPVATKESDLFLNALFRYLRDQNILSSASSDNSTQVVIGIPSEAERSYREALSTIFTKMGYPDSPFFYEPWGALFYHYSTKQIDKEHLFRGILVVDFGGGTLDCSYLKDFRVRQVWGSNVLGGQLLDDCFYQLFLKQNPGVEKVFRDEAVERYIRFILFREIKEKYSNRLSQNLTIPFRETIWVGKDNYGNFEIPDYPGFLDRLREYNISEDLATSLTALPRFRETFSDGSLDLLKALRETVLKAFRAQKIPKDAVSLVLLTGGSSRWKFFRDMIGEEFPNTKILSSEDPEATISRGLGSGYSLVLFEKQVKIEIHESMEEITDRLAAVYETILHQSMDRSLQVMDGLLRSHAEPKISHFLEQGGTFGDLEKDLNVGLSELGETLALAEKEIHARAVKQIEEATQKEFYRWFDTRENLLSERAAFLLPDPLMMGLIEKRLTDRVFSTLTTVVSVSFGTILTSVLGISGVAGAALSGPAGWLGFFAVGVILTIASFLGFKGKITEGMKKIGYSPWALKLLFPSKKKALDRIFLKQTKELNRRVQKEKLQFVMEKQMLRKQIRSYTERHIDRISFADITSIQETEANHDL